VEIQMDGLNQSQVHPDINYTFAFGMRTALRQDPDIIMVGEIRDRETVDTAIEASLTGHLVFSTIHTNSAVETLTRIDNMGVQPFLMASSIECIIAQRLVRKICPHCKVEDTVDPSLANHIKVVASKIHKDERIDPATVQQMKFYKGKGCEKCDNVGYTGRLGLYEVMKMNNELRKAILTRTNALKIEEIAMRTGMVTLEQAGIIKAFKGETSLSEVYRVARAMEDEEGNTPSVKPEPKAEVQIKPVAKPKVAPQLKAQPQAKPQPQAVPKPKVAPKPTKAINPNEKG
jgi:type II secretory ATPase GspE/PulE/Tfp pilus assembly ATPase PilB-like protein